VNAADTGVVSSPATDPAGPTGQLATWLAQLTLEDIPSRVRERAKALILDGLGCALVGAQLPWSRVATDLVRTMEGSGNHALIGCGLTTSAPGAALLNGTFIQGFELDDFHPLAPLHSGALVIPALLACPARERVSGASWLLAAIAGFETGPRVGLALHGGQMLSRGWHSGSVFGTHSSAAAAGKLLGLSPAQFEDALGLAATQSCGLMAAQYEAMGKRMHHGLSARNGLYAAHLAAGGYTGIKRVFEREYGGFLSTFGEGHDPDATQITSELGRRWEMENIVVKPYAAMGGLHGPLDCLFHLLQQRRFKAEEIERIEVDVSHSVYHHGWWELQRPITPIAAQMNIGYALAVAAIDGAALLDQFSPRRIASDDVWRLIPKIVARHDPAFDKGGPLKRGMTRLRVKLVDGSAMETSIAVTKTVSEPMTNDGVVSKFQRLTAGLLAEKRANAIVQAVQALEALPDIYSLGALLAPVVRGAFD
jgi:2-methylcitrate dehydratase PrpD